MDTNLCPLFFMTIVIARRRWSSNLERLLREVYRDQADEAIFNANKEIASPIGFDTPIATNRFDRLSAAAQGYSTSRARNDIG
ncbi:MAG: hypothetical protein L0287_04290 [Anaerolineae bacterium]|nr:hypothetical protein [Anaerolineae bacterium]